MTANSEATAKKPRGKGKPFVKGDPRINREGRRIAGASMASAIAYLQDKTPEELAELVGRNTEMGRALMKFPRNVPMNILKAIRYEIAQMHDPTPGLANLIIDRVDGKVSDKLQVTERPLLVMQKKESNANP